MLLTRSDELVWLAVMYKKTGKSKILNVLFILSVFFTFIFMRENNACIFLYIINSEFVFYSACMEMKSWSVRKKAIKRADPLFLTILVYEES